MEQNGLLRFVFVSFVVVILSGCVVGQERELILPPHYHPHTLAIHTRLPGPQPKLSKPRLQLTTATMSTQHTQPTQTTQADSSILPIFSATTTSVRQLFNLLKCCGFQSRAQMELLPEGIKVTVEDSRVMQGLTVLACVPSLLLGRH